MKTFETFAGIGSQSLSLNNRPNINYNPRERVHIISEWYIYAIIAYWSIHFNSEIRFNNPTVEEMVEQFNGLILSKDSKRPHTFSISEVRREYDFYIKLFNANLATRNQGSITRHEQWDYDNGLLRNIDLFTYSFPCQDLSTAGNMRGMAPNEETRSSLLWQVSDIIQSFGRNFTEEEKPRVLLMENVSVIDSLRYREDLDLFKETIFNYGYINASIILNSKDLNSPQNRNRYFLISIRQDLFNEENGTLQEVLDEYVEGYKKDNQNSYPKLKQILRNFEKLEISCRNDLFEQDLQARYENGELTTQNKISDAKAYRTFNQAKVVIGRHYPVTPTVTFQGEFSRIRFFDIYDGKVLVRQLGPKQNWQLMGFSLKTYEKVKKNLPETKIRSLPGNAITLAQLDCIFDFLNNIEIIGE